MDKRTLITVAIVVCGLAIVVSVFRVMAKHSTPDKEAISVAADEGSELLDKARKTASGGNDDEAIRRFEEIIGKHPDSRHAESAYLGLISIYEKRNDLLKAKELCQAFIEKFPNSDSFTKTQTELEALNVKILFSPVITPDSFTYDVVKGDSLAKIARKFGTTIELIAKANNLKTTTVRIGQKLKISKAVFSIVVDKSQNILTLKADKEIFKTYNVSTGKDFCTPTGTFKITIKTINPPWYRGDKVIPPGSPDNILGTRWLGISKQGYGIHGTTDPQSIGKQVTEGCVRLKNEDVEELYSIVPEGTEVVIID